MLKVTLFYDDCLKVCGRHKRKQHKDIKRKQNYLICLAWSYLFNDLLFTKFLRNIMADCLQPSQEIPTLKFKPLPSQHAAMARALYIICEMFMSVLEFESIAFL